AGGEVATTLLLPRSELAPAAASAGDSAAALVPGGAETILLVEDDAATRLAARRALLELGYTVLEAGDGTEALELWAEHAPAIDLVVTGAGLPGGEGRALAARIRATRADTRVLVLADGRGPLPSPSGAPAPQRLTADALARRVRSALDRTP
ncbi:MAG TPA: response regulator, partial [Gemmatimonadaceae bacterium]